jgi:hypothetical protein
VMVRYRPTVRPGRGCRMGDSSCPLFRSFFRVGTPDAVSRLGLPTIRAATFLTVHSSVAYEIR